MAQTQRSLRGPLGPLGVALHTQNFTIQGVAAVLVRFDGEGAGTVLTTITLKMKVFVEGHHSNSLLAAWCWNNGLIAAHTQRRKTPVVILNTVRVVVVVCDERRPLQYTGAGATAETMGMKTLSHRFENTVCDPLPTSGAHCQGVHVAVFTLRGAVSVIELHALQGAMAAHTTEAVGMKQFIHGPHCRLCTGQGLTTFSTDLCWRRGDDWGVCVHVFHEVLCHLLQLFYLFHVERDTSSFTRRRGRC